MDLLQLMGLSQGIPSSPMQGSYSPMGDYQGDYQSPMAQQAMSKSRYEQAMEMYPRLKSTPVQYKESISDDSKLPYLEYWPKGETGAPNRPRPKDIPLDVSGVETYKSATRPQDVAADIFSHEMVDTDPKLKKIRSQFEQSMTTEQKGIMKEQYYHFIKNELEPDEKVPTFKEWYQRSGLPAYLRGYMFEQWPKEEHSKYYTPEQMKLLDKAVDYLKTE